MGLESPAGQPAEAGRRWLTMEPEGSVGPVVHPELDPMPTQSLAVSSPPSTVRDTQTCKYVGSPDSLVSEQHQLQ